MVPQHARARRRPARAVARTGGLRILDAGCGPGGNGAWLAEHGDVVGVDLSPDALAFVRARRPETRPVRGDLEALPFADASFDVVVGITVLYTVDDDAAAVARARPGARARRRARCWWSPRSPRSAARTTPPCTAGAATAAPGSRELAHAAGLTVRARDLRVLVPRSARGRRSARSTALRGTGADDHGAASDVERRALDRVFAPLAERRARAARPPRPPVRHVGLVAARYAADRRAGRSRPWRSTTSCHPEPGEVPAACGAIAPSRKNSDLPYTRR